MIELNWQTAHHEQVKLVIVSHWSAARTNRIGSFASILLEQILDEGFETGETVNSDSYLLRDILSCCV